MLFRSLGISHLFVSYERIAATLVKSDLEEISRMRTPDLPTRAAVFAYAIMMDLLDKAAFPTNAFDVASAKKWWPLAAKTLRPAESESTLRKIRSFSLARLLNDLQRPALERARSLYRDLTAAILEGVGARGAGGGARADSDRGAEAESSADKGDGRVRPPPNGPPRPGAPPPGPRCCGRSAPPPRSPPSPPSGCRPEGPESPALRCLPFASSFE